MELVQRQPADARMLRAQVGQRLPQARGGSFGQRRGDKETPARGVVRQ
jgi:hypothetical protein